MDFDLDFAANRYESAQQKRRAEAERSANERKKQETVKLMLQKQRQAEEEKRQALAMLKRQEEERQMEQSINDSLQNSSDMALFLDDQIPGWRINLPPRFIESVSAQSPLFLRLTTTSEPAISTVVSVNEFTASDDIFFVPPSIAIHLQVAEGEKVKVSVVPHLPKGTFVSFQASGYRFSEIPSFKSKLESTLRAQRLVLSEGDLVQVDHQGQRFDLRVRELKPAPSVSLVNTDIEVDVQIPAPSDNELAFIPRKIFIDQSPLDLHLQENQSLFFKFSIPSSVPSPAPSPPVSFSHLPGISELLHHRSISELLRSGDAKLRVRLVNRHTPDLPPKGTNLKTVIVPSANLFVSASDSLHRPSTHDHTWGSYETLSNEVELTCDDHTFQHNITKDFYISVFGFSGSTELQLSVQLIPSPSSNSSSSSSSSSSSMEDDDHNNQKSEDEEVLEEGYFKCKNCKLVVSKMNQISHESFCIRFNKKCTHAGCDVFLSPYDLHKHQHCDHCPKILDWTEVYKHTAMHHQPFFCVCGSEFSGVDALRLHFRDECPQRLHVCRFCGETEVFGTPPDDYHDRYLLLSHHEALCGSRTDRCALCGQVVMLKQMEFHTKTFHE